MTDLHTELESEPVLLPISDSRVRLRTLRNDRRSRARRTASTSARPGGTTSAVRSGEAAAPSPDFPSEPTTDDFFFYDRQELQHSPGNPAETPARNQLINTLDQIQPDSDPLIRPIAWQRSLQPSRCNRTIWWSRLRGQLSLHRQTGALLGTDHHGSARLLQQRRANLQSAFCLDASSSAALCPVGRHLSLRYRAGKAIRT